MRRESSFRAQRICSPTCFPVWPASTNVARTRESTKRSMNGAAVARIAVTAYRVPTDVPIESDGTFEWSSTTLVLVEARAADTTGIGYTYADTATATLIRDLLAPRVLGKDVMANGKTWAAMVAAVRNLGRPGIAAM